MHDMDARVADLTHITVANIVGSGDFDIELDLAAVANAPEFAESEWIESVRHDRDQANRLFIKFTQGDGLGILSPRGVHVITGPDTYEEFYDSKNQLYNALEHAGVVTDLDGDFVVKNIVCTADFGYDIRLDTLAIGLGFENVEYEPEQFPGLVYRTEQESCTILIFGTGKVVVTGIREPQTAEEQFEALKEKVESILSETA